MGCVRQGRFVGHPDEVTRKYPQAYRQASKKEKGLILDTVVSVAGWNRDHARQQLCRRVNPPLDRATRAPCSWRLGGRSLQR
jgi:hypothetical protein